MKGRLYSTTECQVCTYPMMLQMILLERNREWDADG